jgi:hypothetical protein
MSDHCRQYVLLESLLVVWGSKIQSVGVIIIGLVRRYEYFEALVTQTRLRMFQSANMPYFPEKVLWRPRRKLKKGSLTWFILRYEEFCEM